MEIQKSVRFNISDSSSDSDDSIVFTPPVQEVEKKSRKKRIANITDEMKPYLDPTGSFCLGCYTKTKNEDPFVQQVPSRRKSGGIRESARGKCEFCKKNKNIFLTLDKTKTHSPTGIYCFTCKAKTDDVDRSEVNGFIVAKCSSCESKKMLRSLTVIPEVPKEELPKEVVPEVVAEKPKTRKPRKPKNL
jgi:hypothetical protein